MKTPLALALLLLPALLGAQAPLINSSHSGAVNDLVFDSARELLFSAGEDGTVRVWDASGRIRALLRVSARPVLRLALHPSLPQFAVLVGEGMKTDTLAAWDWEQGRELFSLSSAQQLLYVAYAPQGGYLAYSRADFQSLAAVQPQTGQALPVLRKGFGIVSFFVISKNENTIMGYQPSGWITYWDLVKDERLRQLRTQPDLALIRITSSNRHALAASGDKLVAVDLLNGGVAGQDSAPGLARLAVSPAGDEVSAVVVSGAGASLKRWTFGGTTLFARRPIPLEAGAPAVTALASGRGGVYLGERAGTLWFLGQDGERRVLARNLYLDVSDLAFYGEEVAVATPGAVYLFQTDFLTRPLGSAGRVERRRLAAPFGDRPAGAGFLDERRLLAWRLGEEPGELAVLDTITGTSSPLPVAFGSSLRQVSLSAGGLIVVERNGVCRVLEPRTFQTRFQYTAGTVNALSFARGDALVGGTSAASAFGSSLFQINTRTGETVPIRDPSLFVYSLLYSQGVLYSLAVERAERTGERVRTVLARHSGPALENRSVLAAYDGEDITASLVEGPAGRIYCSLGQGPVLVWDGAVMARLDNSGRRARRLRVHDGKLIALNTDSSLSVWNLDSPGQPWEVHLLEGGEWIVVSPQGPVFRSEGAGGIPAQS